MDGKDFDISECVALPLFVKQMWLFSLTIGHVSNRDSGR